MTLHPRLNDDGLSVTIWRPSVPSAIGAWSDPGAVATVVPDGAMPGALNGVPLAPWADAPGDAAGWEALAAAPGFAEPPLPTAAGKKPAAGVVTVEPDGRVWFVAPTNRFGGYVRTFPKGKLDGLSMRAAAIKEAFEESGLRVELTGFLCDSARSTSITRYYTARRIGGTPAAMEWESQAVMLAPAERLATLIDHSYDQPTVKALLGFLKKET